ncbi:hypothetical protein JTE90_017608 [Oedothorax gibbosus]|uniref:Uncharacterized protein n=1 Tax=Oedothorax gibbosus TaxID=931172 RepID=A0AAV6U4A5_9ARAC|nr:hypothetical protein JTE90_017608 [Oedothorax gibbosus]
METKDELLEKKRLRERFHIAVKFLLNCFDSMHFLEMTETICCTLEDVRIFLMSMRSSSRSKEFSDIPDTTMNELGYLKKTTAAKIDLTIVRKEELLLLFIVYHLSLNGKSHFEEVVEDLKNRAPKVVSMLLSCASVPGKIGYLKKYPQYFKLDDDGNLELVDTFNLKFDDDSSGDASSSIPDRIEDSHSPIAQSEMQMPDKGGFDVEPLKILASVETQSLKVLKISNKVCTVDNGDQVTDRAEEKQRSEYSEDVLNTLILKIAESITYLSQYFEINIHSGLLEVVLHVWKDCTVFFGLTVLQQMEVVNKSFSTFHIDGYGRVFPILPKQLVYTSSKTVRMLFCMSYLIIQRGKVHFKELFLLYSQFVGETTYYNDLSEFHFFKNKKDIFFMSSDGYVSLANVSIIRFNFISLLMSNRNKNIPSFNAVANTTRPVFRPPFILQKSFAPQVICRPTVYSAPTTIVNYAPIVVSGGVLPSMFCNPMYLNSGNLVHQKTINPVFNTHSLESKSIIPFPHIKTSNVETSSVDKKSTTINISSVQNISNAAPHCSNEGASTQSKEYEEMTKRIKDSALFLSRCFVFETDDFVLIISVLKDLEQYLNKLPEQTRTDFITKCVDNYFVCSTDTFSRAVSVADCCTVSDEEKIVLFSALLLRRENELHYTQIFSKLFQYNFTDIICAKTAVNQYLFFTKWNYIFSVDRNGNVKLLPIFMKVNEPFSNDEAFTTVSDTEVSEDQNDSFDSESKNEIKDLCKKISTSEDKSVIIKANNINIASQCFNRIIESIMYLVKTFEDISAEQVMRSIFYVLSDVRGLFADDSKKKSMIPLYLQVCESETLLSNCMDYRASYLKDKETLSLALVCLLIKWRKMNYQKLFCALESEDKNIKRFSSAEQRAFIAKENFFILENNDDVSLKELTYFDLDGYFEGDNLHASLRVETGKINYIFEEEPCYRKFNFCPSIVQYDLLFRIHQICKSALHEKISSISFSKSSNLDSSSTVKPEPWNQSSDDANSVQITTESSPNGTGLICLKSTDALNGYPIKDTLTTIPKYEFSRAVELPDCSTEVLGNINTDISKDSSLVLPTLPIIQGLDDRKFSNSDKEKKVDTIKNPEPIFNLLETLSDLDESEKPPIEMKSISCSSIECDGLRDLTKEQRTKNFFIVILSQSKVGFPVSVLDKKVLLASIEVQHYISCVYEGDILKLLQNFEEFYVSPTFGNGIGKSSQRDRLNFAAKFLLNCFDPMHHLKMAKIVCFVLKDVESYLLEMDGISRIEAFSTLPSILMDDLGFLETKEASKLGSEVVSQEELVLLFAVCYLSLNGKSHLDKIVEKMKISSQAIVSGFLTLDSKTVRQSYLEKYPQFFHFVDEECLQLDAAFSLPKKGPSKGVLKTEGFNHSSDFTDSPPSGCQGSSNGAASSKTEAFIQSANKTVSITSGFQEASKKSFASSKTNKFLQSENSTDSPQSDCQRSSEGAVSSKTEALLQSENSIDSPQLDCLGNLVSGASNMVISGVKKGSFFNAESNRNATSALKIEVEINKESKKDILKKTSSSPKEQKSSRDNKTKVSSQGADSFKEKEIVVHDKGVEETAITTENLEISLQDKICLAVRGGIMFLYERFKCQIDMHLVLVVLHVLQEAKNLFLSLTQSEQIALMKNIIGPLWVAAVEDNSGTYLRPSLEASELNKEQMDLLLISYQVSQSENVHYSTLLEMFEKHKIDVTELKNFFSMNEGDCVKFANFPPAKWMAERLFRENNVAGLQDTNIHEITMKRSFQEALSRMPPNWLNNLVMNRGPILFNPILSIPRPVIARPYFGPPFLNSNAFVPQMNYNPITINANLFTPRLNMQLLNPTVMMPKIQFNLPVLNSNIYCGANVQNTEPVSENKRILTNGTSEISNPSIQNQTSYSVQHAKEENAVPVITDEVWEKVKVAIFYLSQHFNLDGDDIFLIFYVLEDVNIFVMKLKEEARGKFVEKCLGYCFSCSSGLMPEPGIPEDENKVALFTALLLKRVKKWHFKKIFEKFLQRPTTDLDLPCGRALLESVKKCNRVFSVSPDGIVELLPSLAARSSQVPSGNISSETKTKDQNTNRGNSNIDSSRTNFSEERNENCLVSKTENASRCNEVVETTVINENTAAAFNLPDVLNNDESSVVVPAINSNNDHCIRNSIMDIKTWNFFFVFLGQSKHGLGTEVLREKLRLASSEVQHYMACVYKDNILNFLQNQDDFYISPATGNVCYKAKNHTA